MKVTTKQFEMFMCRLDNNPAVNKKKLKSILGKMRTCKTRKEFNEYLETIEERK